MDNWLEIGPDSCELFLKKKLLDFCQIDRKPLNEVVEKCRRTYSCGIDWDPDIDFDMRGREIVTFELHDGVLKEICPSPYHNQCQHLRTSGLC